MPVKFVPFSERSHHPRRYMTPFPFVSMRCSLTQTDIDIECFQSKAIASKRFSSSYASVILLRQEALSLSIIFRARRITIL
jgi:hypothetical protein